MNFRLRWIFGALFVACMGASFVPGLPIQGFGQVWFALPVLFWFRAPAQRRRLLLYSLGIALQVLAFPDPDWGVLGWVLLLPYLLARGEEDGTRWWRAAVLYGFLRAHVGFFWLGNIHFVAWFAVSVFSGMLFATVFEGGMRLLRFAPYAFRVATAWVVFEWSHGWLFGGFPWLYLAHTQYAYPVVLQAADVVGAFGISFLIAYVQAASLRRGARERLVALALFGALLGYGVIRVGPGEGESKGPLALLVQTDYAHSVKAHDDPTLEELFDKLDDLTAKGLEAHPDADFIVWPETMFPFPYIEGDPEDPYRFLESLRYLAAVVARPAFYGINSYTSEEKADRYRGFNALCVVDRDGELRGLYRKQRLVPMGEELLLRRFLPEHWCDAVMRALVEWLNYPATCDLEYGTGFVILDAGRGMRAAPLICFEGLYPDLAREALHSGEADFLLHLMNNGWFGAFEPRQAIASWVFRAVEARTSFVSCANVGQSCIVAPSGRITARLEPVPAEGVLVGRVPPRWPEPIYLRGGYLLLPVVLALLTAWFAVRARGRGNPGATGGLPQGNSTLSGPS